MIIVIPTCVELQYESAPQGMVKPAANWGFLVYTCCLKLQALVYDILPSTTAVFSYAAIGSRKSANEQFFCWCSNSSKFVTNNSNKTRRVIYSRQQRVPLQWRN